LVGYVPEQLAVAVVLVNSKAKWQQSVVAACKASNNSVSNLHAEF